MAVFGKESGIENLCLKLENSVFLLHPAHAAMSSCPPSPE